MMIVKQRILLSSALVLLVITLLLPTARAGEGVVWISGDVLEVPSGVNYGGAYYEFNFTIKSSNSTLMTFLPLNITVVVPLALMTALIFDNATQNLGRDLNVTGEVVSDQPNFQSIPAGDFIVSAVNGPQIAEPGWIQSLKDLWNAVSGIGKMLVTLIVQVIGATIGVVVPEWVIALSVVGFTLFAFARWFKKLPWILIIIGFIICAAIVSSMIQSLML